MRLRQIEVFHAVYTSSSMTSAAALLHVSQPAISKVLAHTEQQLGYPLFDRVKGRLVPTPEAHQLFSHVASVYQSIDHLKSVARNLRASDEGRIRVAATPAFGIDLLPLAVASYQKKHPETRFELETLHHHEIQSALLQSSIDVGLTFNPESVPGIARQTLGTGEFMVLAPPGTDLGDGTGVGIAEIARHPFISLNSKGPLGRKLGAYLESSDIEFNTIAVCETYHMAKALVACNGGVSIVDEVTARSAGHDCVQVRPLRPELSFDITACHNENAPPSLVTQRFVGA